MSFKNQALRHWAAGLPVVPLRPSSKVPALTSWQAFCATMPTEEQRTAWLLSHPDGNIGLPLGPQAGIVAVDLDSEDPRVQDVLAQIMPTSPWTRVGKKGAVYAFKYSGERTYRIKGEDNKTILEVLSRGTQIVLPPSIHPDTQRPYTANAELVDVLDQLPSLPADFEQRLRAGLEAAGIKLSRPGGGKITDWVPAGGRDSALTAMAGLQARGVMRKERSLLEAIRETEAWLAAYTEQVVGDPLDPSKPRKKVLEFLRRDIVEGKKQLPPDWNKGLDDAEKAELLTYFGEDVEAWDEARLLEHLTTGLFELDRQSPVAINSFVEDFLLRLARSDLTDPQEDSFLNLVSTQLRKKVTMGSLRTRLQSLKGLEKGGKDHNEVAEMFRDQVGAFGELRFHEGSFHQWCEDHWKQFPDELALRKIAQSFGKLPAAKRASDHLGILRTAKNLVRAPLRTTDGGGINFANGFLTPDLELLPHAPEQGATYVLPFRYLTEAPAPLTFLGLLDTMWGGDNDYAEKVEALREAIAVTLFGEAAKYQRAFCLHGVARSGKSTLLDVVFSLMPKAVTAAIPPQAWSERYKLAELAGKLANRCGELSEHMQIAGDRFKEVVDGSPITAERKFAHPFEFSATCAHWFAGNFLPKSRDSSDGFSRRWLFFSCTRAIDPRDVKISLAEDIIADEREAIVAWALPAILDVRRKGYTLPASHRRLASQMACETNPVRNFLSSDWVSIEDGPKSGIAAEDLYRLFHVFYCGAYSATRSRRPPSQQEFATAMLDLVGEFGLVTEDRSVRDRSTIWYANVRGTPRM